MSASLERARLLFAHERYELAERELRGCLADEPENVGAHYLLALCLSELKRHDEAISVAGTAISLAPDDARTHYAQGKVLFGRNKLDDAILALDEAIRLNPNDADYRAFSAVIHIGSGRWQHAADETEVGLQIDPRHTGCLNIRAMALNELGRRREANQAFDVSLATNAENASTHAGKGWALLHDRHVEEAAVHFREALRINPNSESAREGLITAIKAHNVFYRWSLSFFLRSASASPRLKSLISISLFLTCYLGAKFALALPEMGLFVWPVVGLCIAFVVATWLADPLFDFALRFHPIGKHAVDRDRSFGAACVLACLALGIPLLIVGAVWGVAWVGICGVTHAALSVPVSATFACERGKGRTTMAGLTFALAVAGFSAAVVSVNDERSGIKIVAFFLLGILLSMRLSNSVRSSEQRKDT